jgi:hypothetical protein
MHRPRSIASIYRLRLAAVLWCARFILFSAAICIMLYGFCINDPELTGIGAGAGVLGGVLAILQWTVATKARCPLCVTPVLAHKACSRHRHAKTIFGSHRTRVALAIVFKNQFFCPYCNEPTLLQLRNSVNPRNR